MEIKAVKFRKDGFYTQPFAFGGEEMPTLQAGQGEVQQGVNGYQLSAVSYQLGSN